MPQESSSEQAERDSLLCGTVGESSAVAPPRSEMVVYLRNRKPLDNRLVDFVKLRWLGPPPSASRSRTLVRESRLNLGNKQMSSNLPRAFQREHCGNRGVTCAVESLSVVPLSATALSRSLMLPSTSCTAVLPSPPEGPHWDRRAKRPAEQGKPVDLGGDPDGV
jgi:hypothetical protein